MKLLFLALLPLLVGPPSGGPAAVRVTFSPLTKIAYLAAKKGCIATKPRVTFPLKKIHGRLVIPLAKGKKIFRDSNVEEDNPEWEKFEYQGYLPQVSCHLIFHRHYEWSRMIVLSESGQQLVLQDGPAFSPDLNSFVAISAGFEYWANDNYVRLFRFKNHTWREVWHITPKTWEPNHICWTSNNTLLLSKTMGSDENPGTEVTHSKLVIK